MIRLLASVQTPQEAERAITGGADIIDLKAPDHGALGRLPDEMIRSILRTVAMRRPVSATIGDMPLDPWPVLNAVRQMTVSGVDIVKLGIFAGDIAATLDRLAGAAREGTRLVAVLFADRRPNLDIVDRCADAGFYGVMLDTADKSAGPLTLHFDRRELVSFVDRARRHRLFVGLAGSLREADVPSLVRMGPDYLGFRSALTAGRRDDPVDGEAVRRLRRLIDAAAQPLEEELSMAARRSATEVAGAQSAARTATASAAGTSSAKSR